MSIEHQRRRWQSERRIKLAIGELRIQEHFDPMIDRHGIHGAEDWQEKLGALIREADTVVFVLSPTSAVSKICAWEVDQAVAHGKRIIPVLCRPLGEVRAPLVLAALNSPLNCNATKLRLNGAFAYDHENCHSSMAHVRRGAGVAG